MHHLFGYWHVIKKKLSAGRLFILLDYDGTLVPIRDTSDPGKSILPLSERNLLRRMIARGIRLAIVSGRSLKDLKRMAGIRGAVYSGNHGLELEGPGIRFKCPVKASLRKAIKRLRRETQEKLARIKGAFVEDKGLTFSVHYRLVKKRDIPEVKRIVGAAAGPYVTRREIVRNEGKKILEVKPAVNWDKGKMVSWLIGGRYPGCSGALPVYIGDDTTDENAFKALKGKGITVFVGKPKKSLAEYYVKRPSEVRELLMRIARIKKEEALCRN